jgi:methyl-accepting chemotaxis protein
MTIREQARRGATALIGALVAAMLIAGLSVNYIRFGGPLHQQNQVINDLNADILPPPIFIIEPFLEATYAVESMSDLPKHIDKLGQLERQYDERRTLWTQADLTPALKAQLQRALEPADSFWQALDQRFVPALERNDNAAAQAVHDGELTPQFAKHRAEIDTLVRLVAEEGDHLRDTSQRALWLTIGAIGLVMAGLIGALATAARLMRARIVDPLARTADQMETMARGDYAIAVEGADRQDEIGGMARAMEVFRAAGIERAEAQARQAHVVEALAGGLDAIAAGNMTFKIREPFSSEYERLRSAFNATVTGLDGSLTQVAASATSVHRGSSEIRAASDDLARRTEQQAASLEETSAAMSQVTAMVGETARGAGEVRGKIGAAREEAAQSGAIVREAVEAMDAIERSSQEIGSIINVIDGIAFQTNLLALNAGVEAARAGDAGKGFAVVANEVRALAQRSADAAKDIKALITTSSQQVSHGVGLVGETGKMLDRIAARIAEVNGLVAEIATGTETQAANLQQVNGAVNDMDKMTQQNAAMVEQSTAAARSLASEADELAALVARFRLSAQGRTAPAPNHQPAPPRTAPRPARAAPATHGNLALKTEPSDEDWTEF